MSRTRYPTIEEALYLHAELLERFGGSAGIIDLGLLESALGRPRSGYYDSLSEQAAALMQSLALNHCFIDGNRRVAFALTAAFLLMNGFDLEVPPKEGERFIVKGLIQKKMAVPEIASWLEAHMLKISV